MSFQGWLVFLHVAFVLAFVFLHGTSATTILLLRRERDPDRVRLLLRASQLSVSPASLAGIIFIVFGIWAGANGGWWGNGHLWLWTSVVLLVVVIGAMYGLISRHTYAWRDALKEGAETSTADLDAMMTTDQPLLGSAIGIVGLIAILWLMMAKPF